MSEVSPVIAIVIVSYNTVDLLRECLSSIEEYAQRPCHIIVVDNASSDNSAGVVRSEFPDVQLIANAENRGYPSAVNQGLQAVDSAYYFILNSDIRLTDSTLPALADHMSQSPKTGFAAPAQISPNGKLMETIYHDPTLVREFQRNILFSDILNLCFQKTIGAGHRLESASVDWVMGAALFVRREAIQDVGYMDDTVFMYGEEYDWAYRMRAKGWNVYFVPDSVVVHHENASASKTFNTRRYGHVIKSDYYFRVKHLGWVYLPFFVIFQGLGSIMRIVLATLMLFLGSREARSQILEHSYALKISCDPSVYKWIYKSLGNHD